MSLESFSFARTHCSFNFRSAEESVSYDIQLSSMADLCLDEKDLFKPHSEYDIINPDSLNVIYSLLWKEVVSFKPLGKDRACVMEFENQSIFCWADSNELPDCLYEARKSPRGSDFEWWLIDDQ